MEAAALRFAKEEDAAALLQIYRPFVLHTAVSFELEAPSENEFGCRIRQFSLEYPYLVCEVEGTIAGYAYAHRFKERAAYQWGAELSVYVAPQFARRGIGTALYAALIGLLTRQNVVNLYAAVTLPNAASEGLHRSFGFVLAGVYHGTGYKQGQWHDVAFYEKRIGSHDAAPEPFVSVGQIPEEEARALLIGCAGKIHSHVPRIPPDKHSR